ncbi:hypothetical protein ACIHFE_20005 [Streptomyces sp. NPDC052396]|uniref:hypothetical protein n=1 Tax=Streptomyces sp. NPDC052396 TaxID=3365689 RepID=UPI0037D601A0
MGITAALLCGIGAATAVSAAAAPARHSSSTGAAEYWNYAGTYSTLSECTTAGKTSGARYLCEASAHQSSGYDLRLWY